jgi:hypothetical protein
VADFVYTEEDKMTECGCISVDVDDPLDELEEVIVTSSVRNKCVECGRVIEPGEEFEHFVGVDTYYDRVLNYSTCLDCQSIRNEFFCKGWLYGDALDDVRYHVEEMNGEISSECLARLTPGAREIVVEFIDDVFNDINEEEGNGNG